MSDGNVTLGKGTGVLHIGLIVPLPRMAVMRPANAGG